VKQIWNSSGALLKASHSIHPVPKRVLKVVVQKCISPPLTAYYTNSFEDRKRHLLVLKNR